MTNPIVSTAFARAGLLGNPSDGYHGKAIGLSVRNFQATVRLQESDILEIRPSSGDLQHQFQSLEDFVAHIDNFGFYGGIRLIKAAIKRFHRWNVGRNTLHGRNFSVAYQTTIPRSVGLAGSSAIVTATLRALQRFYEVRIPNDVLASLTLSVEKDLLGISAGLMDRVVQAMEAVVFMDFSVEAMHKKMDVQTGTYDSLPRSACESRLYLAWADEAAEPTEVLHNRLRERFHRGDNDVVRAMKEFASLAQQGREALATNNHDLLSSLIDTNFDLRASICQLPALHRRMVKLARQGGASAKFCGSGGAIIGTVPDASVFANVETSLATIGCKVIRPIIRADASR